MSRYDDDAVDQINEAARSDAPRLIDPQPNKVELLRGLQVEETGDWQTVATVKELTGADEEHLAQLGARDSINATDYMTGVLECGVVSIGDLPGSQEYIDKLVLPDRDMLFLGIMKATYGDEREIQVTCGKCQHDQGIVLELDKDFIIIGTDRDLRTPMTVKLSKGDVQFRLPNGEMTSYALSKHDSIAHMNTLIIAQCVITKDDAPLEERIEWARDLPVPDRKKVDKALTEQVQDVGPQLGEVEARCANCETDLPLMMDWVSLLLG